MPRPANASRSGRATPGRGLAWLDAASRSWLAPVACILIGLPLRLWALRFQPYATIDGTDYIRFAEALMQGRLYISPFPPGYPALIALAEALIPDRVMAAALVSLVCGALLPWPVWLLARSAVGERWAALPALAVALHPELVLYSALTLSESSYLLALYGGLALVASRRALGAGAALGAAFAIRPEALVPAGALAAAQLRPVLKRAASPRSLALLAGGFIALATPCWLYFHASLGAWTLTPKVELLRTQSASWHADEVRLVPQASPETRFGTLERVVRYGPDALRHYPGRAVGYARALHALWPAPLLLLSLVGLRRRRGLEAVPLLHLLVLPLFVLGIYPRFVLSAVPALAILAAVPLATVDRKALRLALWAAWLAGAIWCGATRGPSLAESYAGNLETQKQAGLWLSGAAETDAIVLDRKPDVAFYARRPYRVLPDEPYDTLVTAAVRMGARYLVVDEGVDRIFRPQLLPLLHDTSFAARETRLEPVYLGGLVRGYGIAIFRVLRPGEARSGSPPHVAVRWMRGAHAPR